MCHAEITFVSQLSRAEEEELGSRQDWGHDIWVGCWHLATSIGSVLSSVGKGKSWNSQAGTPSLPPSLLLLPQHVLSNFITYALVSPDATLKILILMADWMSTIAQDMLCALGAFSYILFGSSLHLRDVDIFFPFCRLKKKKHTDQRYELICLRSQR